MIYPAIHYDRSLVVVAMNVVGMIFGSKQSRATPSTVYKSSMHTGGPIVPESRPFDAICSQHGVHPEKCWEQHVNMPTTKAKSREEEIAFIAQEHLRKQRSNAAQASTQPTKQEERIGSEATTTGEREVEGKAL
jgi:hypothetical protein